MPTNFEWLIQEISEAQFTPVRLREGYDMGEVDQFLDRLSTALRAGTPIDDLVASARFTPVRMREGYDMAEVDGLLAKVAAAAAAAEAGPSMYADAPDEPVTQAAVPPLPSVIQEQRGLWSRLFGRG